MGAEFRPEESKRGGMVDRSPRKTRLALSYEQQRRLSQKQILAI